MLKFGLKMARNAHPFIVHHLLEGCFESSILEDDVRCILNVSVAFCVFRLLAHIKFKSTNKDQTPQEREKAYYMSSFFFLSMVILSVALQQMSFVSSTLGQIVKAALITAIYRRMLVRDGY